MIVPLAMFGPLLLLTRNATACIPYVVILVCSVNIWCACRSLHDMTRLEQHKLSG